MGFIQEEIVMKKTLILTTAIGFSLLGSIANAGSRIVLTNPPANSTATATIRVNACTDIENMNKTTTVPLSQLQGFANQFNEVGPTLQACQPNAKGQSVKNSLSIRFSNGGVCAPALPLGSPTLVVRFNKAGKFAGCSISR